MNSSRQMKAFAARFRLLIDLPAWRDFVDPTAALAQIELAPQRRKVGRPCRREQRGYAERARRVIDQDKTGQVHKKQWHDARMKRATFYRYLRDLRAQGLLPEKPRKKPPASDD